MIKDYLGHDIVAFSGDNKNMWLIVYDGKYNYYLFNALSKGVLTSYKQKRMPCNTGYSVKHTEYYTVFNNAIVNLCKIVANNEFF